jgi:hypothetical protein
MKIRITTGMLFFAAAALAGCGGSGSGNGSAGNGTAPASNAAAPAAGNEGGAPPAEGNATEGESPGAAGSQQDFTIVNNTGQTVMTLNVSPSDQNSWGPDILGQDVLANGQQGQIQFARGQEQCNWDIRATFEGGETGDWRNVNLCETTTITLTASE